MKTENSYDLNRFVVAQQSTYEAAFSELVQGKKRSHWMWFIFPQVEGLGRSETAKFYGLKGLGEAEAYLSHPVLGQRIIEISTVLINLEDNDPYQIFGNPDDLKLKSCMTLFSHLPSAHPVFRQVLNKFFAGSMDNKTLAICGLL